MNANCVAKCEAGQAEGGRVPKSSDCLESVTCFLEPQFSGL